MIGCYKREMRQQERGEKLGKVEAGAGEGSEWKEIVNYKQSFCVS